MDVSIVTYDSDPDHGGFGARVHALVQMFASFAHVRVVVTDWFTGDRVPGVEYVPFPVNDTALTRLRRMRTFYKTDFPRRIPVADSDLLVVETLDRWRLALEGAPIPRILDEHNIYWDLWRYDMGTVPFFSTWLGRRPLVRRVLEPHLWDRAKRFEVRALREADGTFVTSKVDRTRVLGELPELADRVHVLPNTVDVRRYSDFSDAETTRSVLFVGNYAYSPNQDAARFIAERLAPKLPRTRFLVVGGDPPPLSSRPQNVYVAGYIRDLSRLLQTAAVCLAPLSQGSGTRLKILTYLASGKAVVATTKAVEGLDVEDGEHLLIRDDPDAFLKAVSGLLEDRETARDLGRKGRRLVEEKYDWRVHVPWLRSYAHGMLHLAEERPAA